MLANIEEKVFTALRAVDDALQEIWDTEASLEELDALADRLGEFKQQSYMCDMVLDQFCQEIVNQLPWEAEPA